MIFRDRETEKKYLFLGLATVFDPGDVTSIGEAYLLDGGPGDKVTVRAPHGKGYFGFGGAVVRAKHTALRTTLLISYFNGKGPRGDGTEEHWWPAAVCSPTRPPAPFLVGPQNR